MSDPVIVEIRIDAPVAAVWRALREPDEIRRWHGWDYEGLETEIETIYLDDVVASEEELTLDTGAGSFRLEPRGDTTLLRVTRPAPPERPGWDGVYDELNEGWLSFAHQLRYYLERHPGEDRRTTLIGGRIPIPPGEPWFDSEHQVGVSVDGHSLVIITADMTIVSSYGLDEAAFADLESRLAV